MLLVLSLSIINDSVLKIAPEAFQSFVYVCIIQSPRNKLLKFSFHSTKFLKCQASIVERQSNVAHHYLRVLAFFSPSWNKKASQLFDSRGEQTGKADMPQISEHFPRDFVSRNEHLGREETGRKNERRKHLHTLRAFSNPFVWP